MIKKKSYENIHATVLWFHENTWYFENALSTVTWYLKCDWFSVTDSLTWGSRVCWPWWVNSRRFVNPQPSTSQVQPVFSLSPGVSCDRRFHNNSLFTNTLYLEMHTTTNQLGKKERKSCGPLAWHIEVGIIVNKLFILWFVYLVVWLVLFVLWIVQVFFLVFYF